LIGSDSIQAHSDQASAGVSRAGKRKDLAFILGLFWLGFLTRLAFPGSFLYHWDSINFAFSLERFDVGSGQPHVPGYILYVFLGRLVNLIFSDGQTTFVAISILSSGLAVAMLYILGRDLFNQKTGLFAALFLASSPLFWFYGLIALPHSLDAFAVLLTVWLFYRLIKGDGWYAGLAAVIVTAAWFGIAGGFRPQTQVFLMPLALLAAWKIGWRRSLVGVLVLACVNLAWFIPLVQLNGGLARYMTIMGQFSEAFNSTTSVLSGGGLWGLARNLRKLGMYSAYGWGLAVLPAVAWFGVWLYNLPARLKQARSAPGSGFHPFYFLRDIRFWILGLWIGPSLAYYIFIHMGQQGLVFVFLPALFLLSALALIDLFQQAAFVRRAALAAVLIANAGVFLAAPTYPLGGNSLKILTLDTVRRHDEIHASILEGVQKNFREEHTLLLASWWRFPQYYLPGYTLIHFDVGARWEMDEGQGSLADETLDLAQRLGISRDQDGFLKIDPAYLGLEPDPQGYFYLVLFDESLEAWNRSSNLQEEIPLNNGGRLVYLRFTSQERFYLSDEAFDIVPAGVDAVSK
jgi:hypothetical protein